MPSPSSPTHPDRIDAADARGALDRCMEMAGDGEIEPLFDLLQALRQSLSGQEWKAWVDRVALVHPIRFMLHARDPFTHRAFVKPRGYPGDATTIDYLYSAQIETLSRYHPGPPSNDVLHRSIVSRRPSAVAVAERCLFFADAIDAAASRPEARVLSVAAGHLREALLSTAVSSGAIRELIAIDSDVAALREIERHAAEYGETYVHCVQGSVLDLIRGRMNFRPFDLVYAAGLFDYLTDRTAGALMTRMASLLAPGGHLVVANFAPAHPDQGYMESFMSWDLVYRSEARMLDLLEPGLRTPHYAWRTWMDAVGSIVYLELTRN